MSKVVSLINMKGCVGKTRLAMQLTLSSGAKELKVLAVDLDPQSNLSQAMIDRLGRLFESMQFLPELRDVHEFLRRNGMASKTHKSRREALLSVLKTCRTMPLDELRALVNETEGGAGQSDFSLLANQLMGKGR